MFGLFEESQRQSAAMPWFMVSKNKPPGKPVNSDFLFPLHVFVHIPADHLCTGPANLLHRLLLVQEVAYTSKWENPGTIPLISRCGLIITTRACALSLRPKKIAKAIIIFFDVSYVRKGNAPYVVLSLDRFWCLPSSLITVIVFRAPSSPPPPLLPT